MQEKPDIPDLDDVQDDREVSAKAHYLLRIDSTPHAELDALMP